MTMKKTIPLEEYEAKLKELLDDNEFERWKAITLPQLEEERGEDINKLKQNAKEYIADIIVKFLNSIDISNNIRTAVLSKAYYIIKPRRDK